jgi:glucose/arabinose dehydrogenase
MIGFKERTWRITLYKRELQPDGRVADVEMETFDQARAKGTSGDIREANGRLVFLTDQGKEVVSGGISFVAREL